MRFWTLASFAPLFIAPLAHAQAPGEVQPVVVAPVVAQPVVVAPVVAQPVILAPGAPAPEGGSCAPREAHHGIPVMDDRWAIGLSVGGMSLAPKDLPDNQTSFAIGELALRFRATRHFELELAAGGGRERTKDGMDGDLEVSAAALALRYRFRPEAHWNWYVMGGLGGASVTRHDATQQEKSDATQPLGTLGIGTEYRFHNLAIQAELRGVVLGKAKQDSTTTSDPPTSAMSTTTTTDPGNADLQRTGGSFSFGLSYYF
jgi:opacity protein-like surface antigen